MPSTTQFAPAFASNTAALAGGVLDQWHSRLRPRSRLSSPQYSAFYGRGFDELPSEVREMFLSTLVTSLDRDESPPST